MSIKDHIRQIADFPKPGILFYDISTLLADAAAWRETVHQLTR
ncbi:MAG: adenine phosphoribosyltransferase, partial [Dongiaceae bacterium]